MSNIIAIIGVTGTQAFLGTPGFTLRGVTRDRDKPESLALEKKGIEIVVADIDDQESLRAALAGAHIVFGNTAYPSEEAMKPGMQKQAYELELQQGKNIADAVSTVPTLQLFIWSSLSASSKWSKGQYQKVWHFDSKAHVVDYIHKNHPRLVEKMSILQMGLFANNWKNGPILVPWDNTLDGTFVLRIPGKGDVPVPFVVPEDAGFSDRMSWTDYVALWSKTVGVPARLEKTSVSEHAKLDHDAGFAEEIGEMYGYMVDFGYHGGDPSVTFSSDVSMDQPPISLKEYIESEDWTPLLSR